jgi:magnesium transporter
MYSGLDINEIPRLEVEDGVTYIITKYVIQDDKQGLHTFLIVLAKDYILTLCDRKPTFIDEILKNRLQVYTTQRLKMTLSLFFAMNKGYDRATQRIVRSVNAKKTRSTNLRVKDSRELIDLESLLNGLLSSYNYLTHVYMRAQRYLKFYDEDKDHIEDLIIETNQGRDLCQSSLKAIATIRQHLDIILSHRLNKSITILTIFTVIISIPAAVSGVYGMNIPLPFQENPHMFYYMMGGIVVIWILFITYFKKNNFL